MMRRVFPLLAVVLAMSAAACASRGAGVSDPGMPSDRMETPARSADGGSDTTVRGHSAADVTFLQGMIHHHAQALVMAAMIPSRTARAEMRLLGQRIVVSQRDEIASMRQWLVSRGEYAPDVDSLGAHVSGGHGAHAAPMPTHEATHHDMPGMLTEDELSGLAAAAGETFDRLFLERMIRHHEGALEMVRALFATPGAAQEPELFGIASEVDADQRAEIARMRAMLRALPGGAHDR